MEAVANAQPTEILWELGRTKNMYIIVIICNYL